MRIARVEPILFDAGPGCVWLFIRVEPDGCLRVPGGPVGWDEPSLLRAVLAALV